jgi:V/A-type H+-transporting ATPase subunit I
MIVKMKKVTLAALTSTISQTIEALRHLGVIHVDPVKQPESKEIDGLKDEIETLEKALNTLVSRSGTGQEKNNQSIRASIEAAKRCLSLLDKKIQFEDRLKTVEQETERLAPLGDFSPNDVAYLKKRGLNVRIYKVSKKQLKKTDIHVAFSVVGREGSSRYILTISRGDVELPFEQVSIPVKGLSEFESELDEIKIQLSDLNRRLDLQGVYVDSLKNALAVKRDALEFAEVVAGMGQEGGISYLQGYCPGDDHARLRQEARRWGWGLLVADPSPDSEVPTHIKNPAWIRIIEPAFKVMGTLPGYNEFDISFWFLISLSIFFAMLVGDGGYGILFLMGTLLTRRRFKTAQKEPFFLLYVFSLATVIWGLVTGTWFGVEAFSRLPYLNQLILPNLNSYSDNQNFMLQLCFTLGAVHLTIAHILSGLRLIKSVRILSELGWIFILWYLYLLANHFVLRKPLPDFSPLLLITGIVLAGLFSNPQRNFFKSSLMGFAELPLKIISSFSDLVSYLRLFAVGYATLVIAVSFNQMAYSLGGNPLLKAIGAAVILLLGHTLNILLAAMAVLVHGVRLNMLEFSSHLGMGWTGRRYRPLKKRFKDQANQET